MPSVSQSQRGLIFSKRNKYNSEENTPKKWKWIWDEGWENKGKLPEKVRKKKKNKKRIHSFESFVNENYNNIKKIDNMSNQELEDENKHFIKLQNKGKLTPQEERRWKKISKKLNEKD